MRLHAKISKQSQNRDEHIEEFKDKPYNEFNTRLYYDQGLIYIDKNYVIRLSQRLKISEQYKYLDGQPLLNNYNDQRTNTYLMDVDYNNTSGPIIPVNQELILYYQYH